MRPGYMGFRGLSGTLGFLFVMRFGSKSTSSYHVHQLFIPQKSPYTSISTELRPFRMSPVSTCRTPRCSSDHLSLTTNPTHPDPTSTPTFSRQTKGSHVPTKYVEDDPLELDVGIADDLVCCPDHERGSAKTEKSVKGEIVPGGSPHSLVKLAVTVQEGHGSE
jgi:hypothetical protein